jgi:hypothetical protein
MHQLRYPAGVPGRQRREIEGKTKSQQRFQFANGLFYQASRGRFIALSLSYRNPLFRPQLCTERLIYRAGNL